MPITETQKNLIDRTIDQHIETVDNYAINFAEKDYLKSNVINSYVAYMILHDEPTELVEYLLQKGANLKNPLDQINCNTLSYIIHNLHMLDLENDTVYKRLMANIKLLLANGANINELSGIKSNTPLHIAISRYSSKYSLKLLSDLIKNGANIHATNKLNETPFHLIPLSSYNKNLPATEMIKLIRFLLENNADLFKEDIEGNRTPYLFIMQYAETIKEKEPLRELVELLMSYGADFFRQDPHTDSILFREYKSPNLIETTLDITIRRIIDKSSPKTTIGDLFEAIYTMNVRNGTEKMIAFLKALKKHSIYIDDVFISTLNIFKTIDPLLDICDDAKTLTMILNEYKPSNVDTYLTSIVTLSLQFENFLALILDHAIKHIQSNHPEAMCSNMFNKLFLLLLSSHAKPEQLIAFIELIQANGIRVDDQYIQTIINVQKTQPNATIFHDGNIITKLLNVYEPSDDSAYANNIHNLKQVFDHTEALTAIDQHVQSIQNVTHDNVPTSYFALTKKHTHQAIQKDDIGNMIDGNPSMLKAIDTYVQSPQSKTNSPIIRTIAVELIKKCPFRTNTMPWDLKKFILSFNTPPVTGKLVKSAHLFYNQPKNNLKHIREGSTSPQRAYKRLRT